MSLGDGDRSGEEVPRLDGLVSRGRERSGHSQPHRLGAQGIRKGMPDQECQLGLGLVEVAQLDKRGNEVAGPGEDAEVALGRAPGT